MAVKELVKSVEGKRPDDIEDFVSERSPMCYLDASNLL